MATEPTARDGHSPKSRDPPCRFVERAATGSIPHEDYDMTIERATGPPWPLC